MTTKEGYTRHGPKADEAAERIIRQEILCCDSMLVSELLQSSWKTRDAGSEDTLAGFDWDHVVNLYPDPSKWTAEECIAWFDEMGGAPCDDTIHAEDVEAWREHVRGSAEPAEIYEWWRVTSWLADKLRGEGECILGNAYGAWWGRCCTGQAIELDGVIQEIAVKAGWVR